jgi:hypothetical protein
MKEEKLPYRQPEHWPEQPDVDLNIVETPHEDRPHPGIIIGPGLLDEENLPGSRPLDKKAPEKPLLN